MEYSRVLVLFLASPGDLTAERRIAREVVDSVNDVVAELHVQVQFLGWEDTLPGHARPQDFINADVDKCHLFVGLLHRRWGSPPAAEGPYSSGFEEEYDRARARRERSREPEIWLFFRVLKPEDLHDPGPQLQKVLAFKAALVEGRSCFYKEFEAESDWRTKFHKYLLKYVLQRVREVPREMPHAGAAASPTQRPASDEASVFPAEPVGQDVLDAVRWLDESSASKDWISLQRAAGEAPAAHIARLQLLCSSWLMVRFNTDGLGVHDLNAHYRLRESLAPQGIELTAIAKTMLREQATCPGWYWLNNVGEADAYRQIGVCAFIETGDPIRIAALSYLRLARIRPDFEPTTFERLVRGVVAHHSPSVREAALRYLTAIDPVPDEVDIVRAGLADGDPSVQRAAVHLSMIRLLGRGRVSEALGTAATHGVPIPEDLIEDLERQKELLPTEAARNLLRSPDVSTRALGVRVLRDLGALQKEDIRKLTADPFAPVRLLGYELLIAHDAASASFKEIDSAFASEPELRTRLQVQLARTYTPERLDNDLAWYSTEGPSLYGAYGVFHAGAFADIARADLADQFARLRRVAVERMTQLGTTAEAVGLARFDSFIGDRFTAAALRVITAQPTAADVELGRRFLGSHDSEVRQEAIRLLGAVGEARDAVQLAEIACDPTRYSERVPAARSALRLAPDDRAVWTKLLKASDDGVVLHVLRHLVGRDYSAVEQEVRQLLYSEMPQVRLDALALFTTTRSDHWLRDLLAGYYETNFYWYNVIAALDTVLYAPRALRSLRRSAFAARLREVVS